MFCIYFYCSGTKSQKNVKKPPISSRFGEKKRAQSLDGKRLLSYNKNMQAKQRKNKIVYILRVLLPLACVGILWFIFHNSLQTGDESSAQSSSVTAFAQEIIRAVAPDSKWAETSGENYEILHEFVRTLAHIAEFALLGALLCWCYFAYTLHARYFYLPITGIIVVPIIDEWLQTFSAGRAPSLGDVMTDTLGGALGLVFALITVAVGLAVHASKKRKKEGKNGKREPGNCLN